MNNTMYYNGYETLSYNALFNFVLSMRGKGKSYWCKYWSISDFLKTGAQFVYLRRYKEELKNVSRWFNDIREEFPDVKLEVKNKNFYINDKLAGYAIPLSTSKILKSDAFPLVNKIIFDEFLIDKGVHRYLTDEITCFFDLCETVGRDRDPIVFFLANSISMTNPYFLEFDIKYPNNKKKIKVVDDVLIQIVEGGDFKEHKKQTRFGKILSKHEYGKYSIDNEFLRDDNTFIQPKAFDKMKYFCTIASKGQMFGVYINYQIGKIYISETINKNCHFIYTPFLENHSPNTMLLKGAKNSLFKVVVDEFKKGNVYFKNIKCKNMMYEVLKKCVT